MAMTDPPVPAAPRNPPEFANTVRVLKSNAPPSELVILESNSWTRLRTARPVNALFRVKCHPDRQVRDPKIAASAVDRVTSAFIFEVSSPFEWFRRRVRPTWWKIRSSTWRFFSDEHAQPQIPVATPSVSPLRLCDGNGKLLLPE
jgi:hypothetical protein